MLRLVWLASLGSLVAFVAGAIISSDAVSFSWLGVALMLLTTFGAWVDFHTRHYGFLTLAPAVCLPAALIIGVEDAYVAMLVGHLLVTILQRSPELAREKALRGAEELSALILSVLVAGSLGFRDASLPSLMIVAITFLGIDFALRATRLVLLDGIAPKRIFRSLPVSVGPRYVLLLLASAANFGIYREKGFLGVVLATVVFGQMYYPWKLLNEQRLLFLRNLQMISQAVDLKDPYTSHHSRRVSNYAVRIAVAMGAPENQVERIRIGSLMHDIGKMAIPISVIRKPSRLTDEEMALMKTHAEIGAGIIKDLDVLAEAAPIVRHHHENYDGTGYPAGIGGEAIPLGSRAILVADAFDALTTDRPYRKGRRSEEALDEIRNHSGRQFDPKAVSALEKIFRAVRV